jgi:thiol:disulfide interchange protein DsbC|tara:strand:- start:15651 stop:16430 length:780 start_codon:yes stop_codon:yes gene_type:complete
MKRHPLKKALTLAVTFTALFSSFAHAKSLPPSSVNAVNKSEISSKFQSIVPFQVVEINDHVTGLYEIVADKGIFYASKDGQFLVSGAVHQFKQGLPNLTEAKKAQIAARSIDSLRSTFVTYKAANERYEVLAFFDSSCGYCRKMHKEISQYNALGITVHYALYPRSGLTDRYGQPAQSALELSDIACSENPNMALNTLMQGGAIKAVRCQSPVASHYELGQWLGVQGTPSIYDMAGNSVMPGYAPASQMLKTLQQMTQG